VLFLVDGQRDARTVRDMARQAGVPQSALDDLLAMGLVAPRADPAAPTLDGRLKMDVVPALAAGTDTLLDSLLPAARTLHPESVSSDSTLGAPLGQGDSGLPADPPDLEFAQARLILLRAVRAEAPLAGSLTVLRLRRARTRADLRNLLDEVGARITKPHRALVAQQTLLRVRGLLGLATP
jgi:hypothetical protein